MKLIYDVSDKPPFGKNLVFALQQMIAIMAATLLVPIIVTGYGLESDPAAALFGAGIGTLVYLLFTKRKSPVFLGSSFTFLGAYLATVQQNYGYWGVMIGVLFAGLVYVLIAVIMKFTGSKWVNKLMPAVIIGPIVTLIGLSLSGTATSWMSGNGGDGYSLITILVGFFTFLIIVLASVKGTKSMKLIPFIIGVAAGYLLALVLTLIGKGTGAESLVILDFTPFKTAFSPFTWRSIVDYPKFYFLRAIETKGQFAPIDGTAIANIALIYVPIAVVELAQHISDHMNLSSIIGKNLLQDPGLDKTLMGDGVGSIVGAFFGGAANTTYGESIGCVAITGNASTSTISVAGVCCMILSFFTPFVAFVNSIPKCVMGGACVALYGFIAVSGLQMLHNADLGDNKNLYVVSAILVTGIGGLTLNFGHNEITGGSVLTITSLATALIAGLITNLLIRGKHPADDEINDDNLAADVDNFASVKISEEDYQARKKKEKKS